MSVGGGPLGESKFLHLFTIAFDKIQFWMMKVTASDHGRRNHSAAATDLC